MPIQSGTDYINMKDRYWYRFGKSGKKYYFDPKSPVSRNTAYDSAAKQGRAMHSN